MERSMGSACHVPAPPAYADVSHILPAWAVSLIRVHYPAYLCSILHTCRAESVGEAGRGANLAQESGGGLDGAIEYIAAAAHRRRDLVVRAGVEEVHQPALLAGGESGQAFQALAG